MKVFVAGSTGALGRRVVAELVAKGHEVTALTRSTSNEQLLRGFGARPVIGDVLDAERVGDVVTSSTPDAVIAVLNALPKRGPIRASDLSGTSTLRTRGVGNLVNAAAEAGTKRFVTESMVFGYGWGDAGDGLITEERPLATHAPSASLQPALDAIHIEEARVLEARERFGIDGVVLRLGLYYGPNVGSMDFMVKMLRRRMLFLPTPDHGALPWIHIDDAARAVTTALEGAAAGDVYNVVDDLPVSFTEFARELARRLRVREPRRVPMKLVELAMPYAALALTTKLAVSNAKAKRDLGWRPEFPTYRDGIARSLTSGAAS